MCSEKFTSLDGASEQTADQDGSAADETAGKTGEEDRQQIAAKELRPKPAAWFSK